MKRAVILHGTGGGPDQIWQPWVKKQLDDAGYEVFAPVLPSNDRPKRATYDKFLHESGWDFSDNILIGHSSGATTVLNLLMADWFPKVKAAVLVGAFLNEKLTEHLSDFPRDLFNELFLKDYDPAKLKQKSEAFYFIHGDNDPYCDIEDAKAMCQKVNGKFLIIKNGHHLGDTWGNKELPQLLEMLEYDKLLA